MMNEFQFRGETIKVMWVNNKPMYHGSHSGSKWKDAEAAIQCSTRTRNLHIGLKSAVAKS